MMMSPLPKKLHHGSRLSRKLAHHNNYDDFDRCSFVDRLIEEEMKSTASIRELIAEHKKKRQHHLSTNNNNNNTNTNSYYLSSGEFSSSNSREKKKNTPLTAETLASRGEDLSTSNNYNTEKQKQKKRGKSKSKRSKKQQQSSQLPQNANEQDQQHERQRTRIRSKTPSNRKRPQPLAEHLRKSSAVVRSSRESVDDSMIPRALSVVSSSNTNNNQDTLPLSPQTCPVTNIPAVDKTRIITKLILGHDSPMEVMQNMKNVTSSGTIITSNYSSPPKSFKSNEPLIEKIKRTSEQDLFLLKEKNKPSVLDTMMVVVPSRQPHHFQDPKQDVEPQEAILKEDVVLSSSPVFHPPSELPPNTKRNTSTLHCDKQGFPSTNDSALEKISSQEEVQQQHKTSVRVEEGQNNHKYNMIKCLQFDPTSTQGSSIYTLEKGCPVVIRKPNGTVNNTCIFIMPLEATQEEEKWITETCSNPLFAKKDDATISRRSHLKMCHSPRNTKNNNSNNNSFSNKMPSARSPSVTRRRTTTKMLSLPEQLGIKRCQSDPEINKDIINQKVHDGHPQEDEEHNHDGVSLKMLLVKPPMLFGRR